MQHSVEHIDKASAGNNADAGRVSLDPNELAALCEQQIGRRDKRFAIERPIEVTTVGLDGLLDPTERHTGTSREISVRGISVDVTSGTFHASQPLLLGMHIEQLGVQYAGLIIRRVEQLEDGTLRLGADFGGPAADVLSTGQLIPRFQSEQMAFLMSQAPQVYDNWADSGVLQKTLLDHVMVCPKCAGHSHRKKCVSQVWLGPSHQRSTDPSLCLCVRRVQVGVRNGHERSGLPEVSNAKTVDRCGLRIPRRRKPLSQLRLARQRSRTRWTLSSMQQPIRMTQAREQELYRYDVCRLDPLAVTSELA